MSDEMIFLGLLDELYGAAEDATRWPRFVAAYANAVSAHASAMFFQGLDAPVANVFVTHNMAPERVEAFERHYAAINPLMLLQVNALEGDVGPSQSTIADDAFERTEFYADFMAPQRFHNEIGAVVLKSGGQSAHLTAVRSKSAGAFGDSELRLAQRLLPHVQRALRLHTLCTSLKERSETAEDALDNVEQAVFMVDGEGHIIGSNRAARILTARSDRITLTDRLRLRDTQASVALDRAIAECVSTWSRPDQTDEPYQLISNDLAITVSPLPRRDSLFRQSSAATVIVDDRRAARRKAIRRFADGHGLTPAESRLVGELAQGHTVQQAAVRMTISAHTAREYLKRVFAKTGACRQAELIQMLSP